ncbi:hypothetical protein M422DRAFT_249320 [Sphaerobolus stellatus SS14]|uniref:P-type ATPase A domain-containing protein n=1 Tax=Sphaerobolus stellatus (strain SS14) TaxID=990650 RepID=A0A0C9VVB9_SPHS4|nr:hypothetical protein M422DRAFT_249320 [Sphaerobolus stellatus SS14]
MVGGPSGCLDLNYSNPEHPSKRRQKERYDVTPFPSSPTPHSANINSLEASAGLFIPEESTKSKKKNRSETWPIPNDGKSYAYIVDLTGSTMDFKDTNGEPLSMANITKNACTDSWEGHTGAYKNRPTEVAATGSIEGFSPDENMRKTLETDDEGDEKGPSVLSVDQSTITGESLAVDKFIGDTIFFTTSVKHGKCYILITQIARHSFVGKTAALVTGSSEKGHSESVMSSIGTTLLLVVILWVTAVWIGGFFCHVGIATPDNNNLLVYALIFLIIGVPVGLPCVTTTTLAVGAAYLARKNAIVPKLSAIESLAGVDILASDKTGTMTANQLSLHEPWVAEGVDVN